MNILVDHYEPNAAINQVQICLLGHSSIRQICRTCNTAALKSKYNHVGPSLWFFEAPSTYTDKQAGSPIK